MKLMNSTTFSAWKIQGLRIFNEKNPRKGNTLVLHSFPCRRIQSPHITQPWSLSNRNVQGENEI